MNIITSTYGRPLYLKRLLHSIDNCEDISTHNIKHFIMFQSNSYDENIFDGLSATYRSKIEPIITNSIIGIGDVLNEILPKCKHEYTLKLDDDAIIRSPAFFTHANEVISLEPNCVFSPFPVGLINNMGGVASNERQVKYGLITDTYYTLRKVTHVGGFSRFAPTEMLNRIRYSSTHSEDGEFSSYCRSNNTNMFYLENALIVEHQESTLGQHARYGDTYFKGRF